MSFKRRTHMAGELRPANIGESVTLNGWIASARDFGGVLFFDVRDRSGKCQCVIQPGEGTDAALLATGQRLRSEFVVSVHGTIRKRENPNPKIPTGEIELVAEYLEILNESEVPPFEIKEETNANEDLRLRYRYLDLRREYLQKKLITRHKVVKSIRDFFHVRGFLEIETPILMKATPE